MTPVPTMHEEMHYDASKKKQREKPIAAENMDTMFECEEERSNPQSNQKKDACARIPKALFLIVVVMIVLSHLL